MLKRENQEQKAKYWRIQYSGHIINLVVQAFLFTNVIEMDELKSYDDEEQQGDVGDEEAKKIRF